MAKKNATQLFFDFDTTYVQEVKKNRSTKAILPIGTEIVFYDSVFNKEERGKIHTWDGNRIEAKRGRRIFDIVESDILEVIKEHEQRSIHTQVADLFKLPNESTQPVHFTNSYNAFGSWLDFGKQLSVKQREEANKKAQDILTLNQENLTEVDFNVLRHYSGWGGIQTDNRGVLYDFYTSPPIANMTWQLLHKIQPIMHGESVLEPSCGTGVFFETAPDEINLHGVELSPTTAQIASILHSNASIFMGSFEQFNLINKDTFDHVIGNAPFGERTISTSFMDLSTERNLDRYFISRSIDTLKDSGTMALIVHPGVSDNEGNKNWRLEMCKKAEFLGAIRLSDTSFRHTHTHVQPDILFFKKLPEDIQRRFEAMNDTDFTDIQFYESTWVDGEYFSENQQNILGNVIEGVGQWGSDVIKGEITQKIIEKTIDTFEPIVVFSDEDFAKIRRDHSLPEITPSAHHIALSPTEAEGVSLKELTAGSNKTIDSTLYRLTDSFQWEQVGTGEKSLPDKIEIIKSIGISVRTIRMRMQFDDRVDELQIQTRKQIENYKELYGVLPNEDKKVSAFLQKNAGTRGIYEGLLSIDADILNKANIYDTNREIVDGHNPAIVALLMMQERMLPATVENLTKLFPHFESTLHSEMLQNPDIFLTPDATFELREDFISGNAWQKIDSIHTYISEQEKNIEGSDRQTHYIEKLQYGINELENAIGWIPIEEADFTPHASWIPESIIDEWIKDENGLSRSRDFKDAIACKNDSDKWGVKHTRDVYEAGKTWRDDRKSFKKDEWREYANDVIYYLNMQKQRSSYNDTETFNREHDEGFKNWIANHEEHRTQLEHIYNKTFNTEISAPTKTYPVYIQNWQETKTLKPHQWQNIHKLYREGCGISALGTGFGKTLSAVGLMSLLQQEGKITRSWVQVPNNKVKDWVAEIRGVRPDLSVGFVDPEMPNYSNQAKRYALYQEIANTKYDIVIMPESAASEIQLSVKNDVKISVGVIEDQMVERGEGKSARGKAMAQEKTIRQLVNGKTNLTICFENFGCDAIFVDEAHRFKNLFSSSLARETGLNDGRQSQKALSLFKKTEYIRQQHDNKNLFLFTATPLTNSPLEYYNMMQFVAPQELQRFGIRTIDSFIKNFSDIQLKASPDWGSSSIKEKKTVVGFKNLRTLQDLFFKYTDLQNDPQAINLDKPTAQNKPNIIPMNSEQTATLKSISERLEMYRNASKEDKAELFAHENFLTFYMNMRTASLDLELYDPVTYKDWSNDKLTTLAQNAHDSYKATNGGQIVFCDRVMSGDGSFNIHGKIKDYLVKIGFKESEIVIVNGFTKSGGVQSDTVKEKEVSGAVAGYNSGKYKVIIGSTATIGEGLNLQKNSAALHHFDIPYRPSDFIQRNGRIDRQGNSQESVELHSYMATGTIDNYSVALVQNKAAWIDHRQLLMYYLC